MDKTQTFEEWWIGQALTGENNIMCRELTKLGIAELAYNAGQQNMATSVSIMDITKTCRTCRFWNFKVSSVKCWGQCLNEKVHNSIYISIDFPDKMKSTKEYYQFMNNIKKNCEVRFEENDFGCVYWGEKL